MKQRTFRWRGVYISVGGWIYLVYIELWRFAISIDRKDG